MRRVGCFVKNILNQLISLIEVICVFNSEELVDVGLVLDNILVVAVLSLANVHIDGLNLLGVNLEE